MIVFYDGDCEFCFRQMKKLAALKTNVVLQDINSPASPHEAFGLGDEVFEDIHGVILDTPSGTIVKGVDVWLTVHEIAGSWFTKYLRAPIIYQVLQGIYLFIKKTRKYL